MKSIRDIMKNVVTERFVGTESKVAVLMSGGIDSMTCAFAAEDAGKQVVCYTFQVGEWESKDSVTSQRYCEKLGWDFHLVKIPPENIERDFLKLADHYRCKSKVQFECTYPFMYLFDRVEERNVITGMAADIHFGNSRKVMVDVIPLKNERWKAKQIFDADRLDRVGGGKIPRVTSRMIMIAKENGQNLIVPYIHQDVCDYFIELDWWEMNQPLHKHATTSAYKHRFMECGYRKHANLQIVSGIDKVFAGLLDGPLNVKNRKRVLDLCRDYVRGDEQDVE